MLQSYYYAAYAAVRKYAPNCFVAISPREWEQDGAAWQFFMAGPPYTKVIQDLHRHAVTSCVVVSKSDLNPAKPAAGRAVTPGKATAQRLRMTE